MYASGYTARPDISLGGVMSGIEMACWDIVGKAVDKPVYELLGGKVHERLRGYTYLYTEADDPVDVYLDPGLAAQRAAEYAARGHHGAEVRPGRRLLGVRPSPARARGARSLRGLRQGRPRGRRLSLRPALRDARAVHHPGRDPPRPTARGVRPALVRGARPSRASRGDGHGRPRDLDPDRNR